MKRLVLIAMLCLPGSDAAAQEQSQFSSHAMNWTHVKNCILDVLPDNDLKGNVSSADVRLCETADQDFYKLITETYPSIDAGIMEQNILLNAATRVYLLESGETVYFGQLNKGRKTDVLEFCRVTCQILNR